MKAADGGEITVQAVLQNRMWQICGIVAAVALVYIYHLTFSWWWTAWWVEESYYSHGVLVPIISGFMVWFSWKQIAATPVNPSLWGLAIMLPAMLIQFAANQGAILSVSGLMLPLVLLGACLLLFGKKTTLHLAFPILFLFFMCVPPSQYLANVSFRIQVISTEAATAGLKLMGLSAYNEGVRIVAEGSSVLVGVACSGFRTLIALLAFTTFFAYMKSGPLWGRITLVLFVFPISVIANSVRVWMIALVRVYYGEHAMRTFHDYSGYIVLFVAFLILIQLAKVVKCRDFKPMP